ncbi:MAG: LacI family DNA-binding transcriptional regulator [Propionicimonas sp.]
MDLESDGQPAAPRLVDVARIAGVSRATAARALGRYGRVSEATTNRVQQAADSLGYRSNAIARAMRVGRTSTIGLVIADISSSFFDQATLAIIRTAALEGYQTLVLNTDEDLESEQRAVEVLLDKRVDGLIVVTSVRTGHQHLLNDGRPITPLVFLDRRVDDVDACVVSTDDRDSARRCVEILASHGHTRIGMLTTSTRAHGQRLGYTSPLAIAVMVDRVTGWMEGIERAGVPMRPDWLVFTDGDHDSARAAAIGLLAAKDRPTALLAANSEVALAIIDACQELGLEIGSDLSLIGFDDPSWARLVTPSLSVVSRPVYQLGAIAVRKLLLQISGEQHRPESLVLPTRIIERDSVSTPREPTGQQPRTPSRTTARDSKQIKRPRTLERPEDE